MMLQINHYFADFQAFACCSFHHILSLFLPQLSSRRNKAEASPKKSWSSSLPARRINSELRCCRANSLYMLLQSLPISLANHATLRRCSRSSLRIILPKWMSIMAKPSVFPCPADSPMPWFCCRLMQENIMKKRGNPVLAYPVYQALALPFRQE